MNCRKFYGKISMHYFTAVQLRQNSFIVLIPVVIIVKAF